MFEILFDNKEFIFLEPINTLHVHEFRLIHMPSTSDFTKFNVWKYFCCLKK